MHWTSFRTVWAESESIHLLVRLYNMHGFAEHGGLHDNSAPSKVLPGG